MRIKIKTKLLFMKNNMIQQTPVFHHQPTTAGTRGVYKIIELKKIYKLIVFP